MPLNEEQAREALQTIFSDAPEGVREQVITMMAAALSGATFIFAANLLDGPALTGAGDIVAQRGLIQYLAINVDERIHKQILFADSVPVKQND